MFEVFTGIFKMKEWKPLFSGEVGKRFVKLSKYYEGDLKVETTQLSTAILDAQRQDNQIRGGLVISAGDQIDIEAANPDELEKELEANGFSSSEAKEIARYARIIPGD